MTPSEHIDKQIQSFPDCPGERMAQLRKIIHEADSEIIEEWKWDTAIYTHGKMICAVSGFKEHVKINFFKGAFLKDTHHLFNNGFDSKQHRSIDFREHDIVKKEELKELVKEAIELVNPSKK